MWGDFQLFNSIFNDCSAAAKDKRAQALLESRQRCWILVIAWVTLLFCSEILGKHVTSANLTNRNKKKRACHYYLRSYNRSSACSLNKSSPLRNITWSRACCVHNRAQFSDMIETDMIKIWMQITFLKTAQLRFLVRLNGHSCSILNELPGMHRNAEPVLIPMFKMSKCQVRNTDILPTFFLSLCCFSTLFQVPASVK